MWWPQVATGETTWERPGDASEIEPAPAVEPASTKATESAAEGVESPEAIEVSHSSIGASC